MFLCGWIYVCVQVNNNKNAFGAFQMVSVLLQWKNYLPISIKNLSLLADPKKMASLQETVGETSSQSVVVAVDR